MYMKRRKHSKEIQLQVLKEASDGLTKSAARETDCISEETRSKSHDYRLESVMGNGCDKRNDKRDRWIFELSPPLHCSSNIHPQLFNFTSKVFRVFLIEKSPSIVDRFMCFLFSVYYQGIISLIPTLFFAFEQRNERCEFSSRHRAVGVIVPH